jgi:Cu-processing system ATP-binding protein
MIEIQNLSKTYGKRRVLTDIDLRIPAGEITAIVGSNAGGKTTLLKCVLGLVRYDQGRILMNGQPVHEGWNFRKLIGYAPQHPSFPEDLTPTETMRLLDALRDKDSRALRLELCEELKATVEFNKKFGVLSGGTKQKVAIIAALAHDPPIVILDEPGAGLDPLSAEVFKERVRGLANRGRTVIVVSHSLQEVEELARNIISLSEGRVGYSGSVCDLLGRTGTITLDNALRVLHAEGL